MDGLSKGKIFLILFFILLSACLFFADTLFDKAVKKTVSLALHAINSKKELLVSIDEVDMVAAKGSLYLRGLKLIPDSLYFNKFKSGTAGKRMLSDIQISEIELTGLNIKNLFWNGKIDSAVISVKNIVTNIYLSKQSNEPTSTTNEQHSRLMDSIHLKGLKRLDLRGIEVETFKINLLDAGFKGYYFLFFRVIIWNWTESILNNAKMVATYSILELKN